jgi:hypothetical protein
VMLSQTGQLPKPPAAKPAAPAPKH